MTFSAKHPGRRIEGLVRTRIEGDGPVAAVLSTALVCVLPAVFVCQRKTVAAEQTPST